jgi:hypothetical protein
MAEPTNLPAARMIVEEARSLLSEQQTALETLRTRAIALLSVGALVATFFGTRLPKELTSIDHALVSCALIAFAIGVALAMVVVRPRNFEFSWSVAPQVKRMAAGESVREYDLALDRAAGLEDQRLDNEKTVEKLSWYLVALCALTAVQVVAWGIVATR